MSTIGKLFGRSPFGQIQTHMEQVSLCINGMVQAIEAMTSGNHEAIEALSYQVSKQEHQADQIKADIRNSLLRRFFLPIDKTEVLEIVSLQDSLADTAEDVCKILTFKQLPMQDEYRADFQKFVELNIDAFKKVSEIVKQLDELIESGFGGVEGERIRSMAHEVAVAEHKADLIQVDLLKKLYAVDAEMSVGEFHLWMRLTRVISKISNDSENLANRVLKTLSIK